jgi:hypothetical protein
MAALGGISQGVMKKLDKKGVVDFKGNKVIQDGDKTTIEIGNKSITIDEYGDTSITDASAPGSDESERVSMNEKLGNARDASGQIADKYTGGMYSSGRDSIAGGLKKVPGVKTVGRGTKGLASGTYRAGKAYMRFKRAGPPMESAMEAYDIMRESPIGRRNSGATGDTGQKEIEVSEDEPISDLKESIEQQDLDDTDEPSIEDMESLTYRHETFDEYDEPGGDGQHTMQRGYLENDSTGEEIPMVSFRVDENSPELEDGETYDLENAHARKWDTSWPQAHSQGRSFADDDGKYPQVKLTNNSQVKKC